MTIGVRPFSENDKQWAYGVLFPKGGPSRVASRQALHDPLTLPGFVAWKAGARVGLATYRLDGEECELLTLDSVVENQGIGSQLIDAVEDAARTAGCKTMWLITTNDNTHALRFYQRRGMHIREVRPGAVDQERTTIKPEIPEVGNDGIPIRDEIELALEL
ncbi:MAG TPA: GNAT family N-acetyltransferase [Actinomycetota bacterium]|nr:GNAT family N-acetyltransferase [Actinomycetota bacterium]